MKFRTYFTITILFFIAHRGYSNLYDNIPIRKQIENIGPSTYKGGPQVWDIKPGKEGYVFFATGNSFTVWDGARWDSYFLDPGNYIRSLFYDSEGERIYCAGDKMFGYWQQNGYGDFEFTKLYSTPINVTGQDFWRILKYDPNNFYLQSHEDLFLYNLSTGGIKRLETQGYIGYIHDVNNKFYVQVENLFYIAQADVLIPTGIEVPDRVAAIIEKDGKLYFFTENKGVKFIEGGKLKELDNKSNKELSRLRIFAAGNSGDDNFIAGTVLDGVCFIDKNGKIIGQYGENNGLDYTTVLSVGTDNYNNIWLGLDRGIAMIADNPNETYYNSYDKKIGNVYATLLIGGKLYLGTNKGLYIVENGKSPRLIDNTLGQVWDIIRCGSDIIINHDKGLLRLNPDESLELVHADSWRINNWYDSKDVYYVSDKSGFAIYELKNGRFTFRNRLDNYDGYFSNGLVDKYGNIWINGMDGQVRKLTVDNDLREVRQNKIYDIDSGGGWIAMHMLDNDVVFNVASKCYSYDIKNDSIVPNQYFTELFELLGFDSGIVIAQAGNAFFYSGISHICKTERIGNRFSGICDIFSCVKYKTIPAAFQRFQRQDGDLISMGYENGVAFYKLNSPDVEKSNRVTLRKIEYSLMGETHLVDIKKGDKDIVLPNGAVNIKFYLTGIPVRYRVQYSLDECDQVNASIEQAIEFAYVKDGKHVLKISNPFSDQYPSEIHFAVQKPFTSTTLFFIIFTVSIILLSSVGYRLYINRLRYIHQRLLKRQTEILEREKIKYDNQLLTMELREQSKKLSSFAMNNIHISNMLGDIQTEIMEIDTDNPVIKSKLRNVSRKIMNHRKRDTNWQVFEKYFNNVYDGFFDKLLQRYPNLRNNDLKICAYIKLGLSTKEIAALMNISNTSVEIARHRLRKKLGISSEVSLNELISEI